MYNNKKRKIKKKMQLDVEVNPPASVMDLNWTLSNVKCCALCDKKGVDTRLSKNTPKSSNKVGHLPNWAPRVQNQQIFFWWNYDFLA